MPNPPCCIAVAAIELLDPDCPNTLVNKLAAITAVPYLIVIFNAIDVTNTNTAILKHKATIYFTQPQKNCLVCSDSKLNIINGENINPK